MSESERDKSIIQHILSYCEQIDMAVERFGNDFSIFDNDKVYRNAVSLCILQIGELVGILSDDFKQRYQDVPWRQIKQMRNIVAHRYGTFDSSIAWAVVEDDIPALEVFCRKII